MPTARRPLIGACLVSLAALTACEKLGLDRLAQKDEGGEAAASAAPSGSAAAAARGPTAAIPAGTFKAGTPCGAVPRITNEELVGEAVSMGAFTIDALPYPNEPGKPPKTGVTQKEAMELCAAAGKRLCTELEWERACKGPNSTAFEYGPTYDQAKCAKPRELVSDARPACASAFGAKDLHGLVFEWTASAWGRGTSGELASVRGGQGPGGVLQARCANGQSRPPTAAEPDLGFRCCSGPVSPAEVRLAPVKQAPMVEEPSVEASLAEQLLRAMPADHRATAAADAAFDRVWRWHPRDSEEILLARWAGRPKDGKAPYFELAAFKVCGGVPSLVQRMKGPVESLGSPGAGGDAQKASAAVSTGADKGTLEIRYYYGSVKFEQPPWIKEGASLDLEKKKPAILRLPFKKGR
jgi:formylglycine-generating enzyme required for sulfatase activity